MHNKKNRKERLKKMNAKLRGEKGGKKGGRNPEKESPLSCDKVDRKCKGDPDSESMTDVKQKKRTETDI